MSDKIYEDSIILIGPSGAGKSTIAEELSKRLGWPRVCLDKLANHARANGTRARIEEEAKKQGKHPTDAFSLAMIQTLIHMVEEYNHPGISDFGAGHAVFETKEGRKEAKELLKPFKNVVLLLPCKDEDKALQIINSRSTGDYRDNEAFMKNPSYKELATLTVYGDGKSPKEIAEMIINEINQRKKKGHKMGEME